MVRTPAKTSLKPRSLAVVKNYISKVVSNLFDFAVQRRFRHGQAFPPVSFDERSRRGILVHIYFTGK